VWKSKFYGEMHSTHWLISTQVMEGLDQMKWAPDMQQLINPNALIAKLERRYESDVVVFRRLSFSSFASMARVHATPSPRHNRRLLRVDGVEVACDSFASMA